MAETLDTIKEKAQKIVGTERERHFPETFRNVGEGERYGSILGGMGLIFLGLMRHNFKGALLGALGVSLVQRGVTGHCRLYEKMGVSSATSEQPGVPDNLGVSQEINIVINQPKEKVYAFWRHLPNLALVMKQLESVEIMDDRRSHWVAVTSGGHRLEWDSEIINEHPNEMIAWESLPGGNFENAGSVHFDPEPHGNGTVLTLKMQYNPPGGILGWFTEKLLGRNTEMKIRDELNRLKKLMESSVMAEA